MLRMMLAAAVLLILGAPPALAQGVLGTSGDTPRESSAPVETAPEASILTRAILYVQTEQQRLHRALAGAIRTLRDEGSLTAASALISLSFIYGLFHAVGPGHGKAVLSAYLLTQPTALRRSLALAAASSFMQGVTAIVIVFGAVAVFGLALRSSGEVVQWLEAASFALVAAVGLWLAWRAGRSLATHLGLTTHTSHTHTHHHAHHDHEHAHGACGHAHVPTPHQAMQAGSLREMGAIVMSIGIRPCTGAVLVLVFAQAVGMTMAGIAAVLAMSAGTALAVALIALAAVGARDGAWFVTRLDNARVAVAMQGIAFAGGIILALLGTLLAIASATAGPATLLL